MMRQVDYYWQNHPPNRFRLGRGLVKIPFKTARGWLAPRKFPRLSGVSCHYVAQRPITESNRPPSYQASTNEPESNRHFLCWWPEVIPASGMARGPTYPVAPEKIIVAAKSLFTCFRITTAHSPTSKRAGVFIPTSNHLLIRIAA